MKRFFRLVGAFLRTSLDGVFAAFSGCDQNGMYRDGWRRYDPDDTL